MTIKEKEREYRRKTNLTQYNTLVSKKANYRLFARPYFSAIGFSPCFILQLNNNSIVGIDNKDIEDVDYLTELIGEKERLDLIADIKIISSQLLEAYEELNKKWKKF